MLRQSVLQLLKPALRGDTSVHRVVQITAIRNMAAGDTGAARPGGAASRLVSAYTVKGGSSYSFDSFVDSDAFNKREKANEDFYVKQKEREKSVTSNQLSYRRRRAVGRVPGHAIRLPNYPWSEG